MLECVYVRRRRESAYRGAGATGLTVRSIMAGGGILLRFRLLAAGSAVSSGSGACSALSSGSGAGSGVSSGSGVGSGVSSGSGAGSGVFSGSCADSGSGLGVSAGEAWVELVSAEEAGSFSPQDVRKRQRQRAAEMTVSASFMTALSFVDISSLTRIISDILLSGVELTDDSRQVG